jgi:hypothetical protein
LIASSDKNGKVIVWHGETGESLTQSIKAHSSMSSTRWIFLRMEKCWPLVQLMECQSSGTPRSLTFCKPGSCKEIRFSVVVLYMYCDWYSPSGKHLAIASNINVEIYNPVKRGRVASFNHNIMELLTRVDARRHTSSHKRQRLRPCNTRMGYNNLDWQLQLCSGSINTNSSPSCPFSSCQGIFLSGP